MTEKLLFRDIDEPGLNTLEVYERRGGYERAAQGAGACRPRRCSTSCWRPACAAAAAPASRWARRPPSCPRARWTSTSCCNADESEPGTFKDRELMQKNPHLLIEGMIIAALRGGRQQGLHLHPRRVRAAGRHPRRRARRGRARPATSASNILGSELHALARRAPRRRRLHLRRGDGAARLARGQARQPAPEAAVPGQPGPLPGPDADQQRRDARDRPAHHRAWAARSTPRSAPRPRPARSSSRSRGYVQRPGNYEIELGIPSREIIYGLAGGPPEGREVKCGSRAARSSPVLTEDDLDLPYDFDSMAKAGSMLGSGAIIVVDDSQLGRRRRAEGREVLPPRVLRQVHAVPRGHELDREDARAHRGGEATPMDLDIMASVQEQIIGNCLCVLGDAMAMPIGSMIEKFRAEFEEHIEAARAPSRPRRRRPTPELAARSREPSPSRCRAPSPSMVTFSIDGREVRRPRTSMLVDARQVRRRRDPRLLLRAQARPAGRRVPHVPGRDRGHPEAADRAARRRSRTAWSSTRRPSACTRRRRRSSSSCSSTTRSTARSATRAASARCRTSPSAGAAGARASSSPSATSRSRSSSRPLIAIDRERCILCYRCVRFSQEVAEDYQLVLQERGADTYVGDVRRAPVRRAVQRQHHRAVPGRAR